MSIPIALAAASANGAASPMVTPSGVRWIVNASSVSTTLAYITIVSVSTIVHTVSRCICARC
ncbi:Uncharacterised protein [Mycobacterium tuberculosis]|uniref:Uncharacterized protein n=2 Tax=Mycobacterium tuberculosis TaxID=1773 RepID=A0A916PBS1_MYCTX|nr:Uncharacterised protein [Mycobacterium tuberculosis]